MSDYNLKGDYKINPFIIEKNESPFAGIGVAVVTPFDQNNKMISRPSAELVTIYFIMVSLM